jgi:CHAT domain-containing protein
MRLVPRLVFSVLFSLAFTAHLSAQGNEQPPVNAPGPFQFREVYPLEFRVDIKKEPYDPNTAQQLSTTNYGPANPMAAFLQGQRDRPETYLTHAWVNLLQESDLYRRLGAFDIAEKQYLDIVDRLRKAQAPMMLDPLSRAAGAPLNDLAFMLDHLAEFYLEERKFELAYKTFSDAVQTQRAAIAALKKIVDGGLAYSMRIEDPDGILCGYQLHLAEMLTRMGQLDLGKGDLAAAGIKLSEAVALVNLPNNTWYFSGLSTLYFRSRVFERQAQWNAAEALWRDAVAKRGKPDAPAPTLTQAQTEMAAFYARKGDFRAASAIARSIHPQEAPHTKPSQTVVDAISTMLVENHHAMRFTSTDGAAALREIIAVDTWRSQGAQAAAPLLPALFQGATNDYLDRGSDPERAQMVAWFQRSVFLQLSILLDGDPPEKRVEDAYTLLSNVKGRYFARMEELVHRVQLDRSNPRNSLPEFKIIDQLAAARQKQSHLFISAALDGKKVDPAQFVANDNLQQSLLDALASGIEGLSTNFHFSLPDLTRALPPDGAFIDLVRWERTSNDSSRRSQNEYGAFVIRPNQGVRFIRLGAADTIDRQIDKVLAGGRDLRGLCSRRGSTMVPESEVSSPQFKQDLKDLYKAVVAPLEPALAGATKLYIVPDGKLALAPLSALIDANGHYLLETRTITYLNSWRDVEPGGSWSPVANLANSLIVADPDFDLALAPSQQPLPSRKTTFAPLPGTQNEGAIVLKAVGAPPARLLTGNMARQSLVQSIIHPEVEHFATHSYVNLPWTPPASAYQLFEFPQPLDTQYPLLQTGIALSGANRVQSGPEDGLLTGLEISSLRLEGTQLAVLSSCDSGQGTVLDGQGVLGLRAALSMAGAQSSALTLWPICDFAGAKFMQFFYSHLSQPPAEALRLAQQDMIADASFSDPRYWSGYLVSSRGVLAVAHGNAPAAPKADQSSLITPKCFEFVSHNDQQGPQQRYHSDVQIRIGGVVRRLQSSPTQVVYDLAADGNDVEVKTNIDHVLNSDRDILGSERKWILQAIIEKQPDSSSLSFRFGPDHQHPENNRTITLKGKAGLFPSLDLPDALPPLASYTSMSGLYAENGAVDQIGSCSSGP